MSRYDLFSDDYDTSEKARVPAWTDRVLWKRRKPQGAALYCTVPNCTVLFCTALSPWPGIPLESWTEPRLVFYGRAELKQSDHRPVIAVVDVQVGSIMMMMVMSLIMMVQARVIDKRRRDASLASISGEV